jgi:hypothetical protein
MLRGRLPWPGLERGRLRLSQRWRRGIRQGNAGRTIFLRRFIFHIGSFAATCAFAFACSSPERARAEKPNFAPYEHAVEFCRETTKRPMALDLDHRVLCFDGDILTDMDLSLAGDLRSEGVFVVRSGGGEAVTAMELANLIHDRHATVVVYDYCLSACASFLLVASNEAFVMRDTLVAWHDSGRAFLCPSLRVAKDGGPKRLQKLLCSDAPEYRGASERADRMIDEFYSARVVDPLFEHPPESYQIRKILRTMFEGTGRYPDVIWTWNPRYYASTLKTKITYEAYPDSQNEVDALVSKFGFQIRALYDP